MTLVELLVSMAIALMVFALVGMVFLDMKKYMLRQEIQVAMIQNARIGLDEMARLIRMAGYNCDAENGQVTLIEAAPFQLTFNAVCVNDLAHIKAAFHIASIINDSIIV